MVPSSLFGGLFGSCHSQLIVEKDGLVGGDVGRKVGDAGKCQQGHRLLKKISGLECEERQGGPERLKSAKKGGHVQKSHRENTSKHKQTDLQLGELNMF